MIPGERFREPRAATRWHNGTTPVIGLTGGVASGKSAVATLLAERGFAAIDADSVGHEVLDLPDVQQKLFNRFGREVVVGQGLAAAGPRVDRRVLAAIVFSDPEARRALEAIVHPLMRARFAQAIDLALSQGPRPVVLDAAVLLEAGWDDLCDVVVFVDSPRSERLRRAADRRGWSDAVFDSRERAQWPWEQKRCHADFVIRNDAGPDSLRCEVEGLVATLGLLGAGLQTPPGPEGLLGAGLQTPPGPGPKVSMRCSLAEPAAANSEERSVNISPAAPRAPVRHRQDGTGSGAWQGPCLVL